MSTWSPFAADSSETDDQVNTMESVTPAEALTPSVNKSALAEQKEILHQTATSETSDLLSAIFTQCMEIGVSDIQIRSDRYIYIETKTGMEKLMDFGVLPKESVAEIFKLLIGNKESEDHGFNPGEEQ